MNGRAEEFIPSPQETAAGLAVNPLPADRARLREILSQGIWKLDEASDCCEALGFLRDRVLRVTLAAWNHWRYDFVERTSIGRTSKLKMRLVPGTPRACTTETNKRASRLRINRRIIGPEAGQSVLIGNLTMQT